MFSEELEKANKEQEDIIQEIPIEQRPEFHFSAPIGWLNDPNGFSSYKGAYHLFYQHNPYSTNWDRMHWGHSKTQDFIKWEQLPVALAPDEKYDIQGCFSGSALEDNGNQVLMYTGVEEYLNQDNVRAIAQTQCIAIGDGIAYQKIKANPVITSDLLPNGNSKEDFRDPKIWKDGDTFFAVAGSRGEDGSGQILLFSSKDLENWSYCSTLQKNNYEYGAMWECPDFFELDGKHVLLVSPQDMEARELAFHCGNGTLSIIGDFDKTNYSFDGETKRAIDYGLDFYAPQTLLAKDGRRIMIAWMQSWDNYMTPKDFKWSGMMTVPRELRIENGELFQVPVREIENYYTDTVTYKNLTAERPIELKGIKGRVMDMTIEVEQGDYKVFEVSLAADETHRTIISYHKEKSVLTFDRSFSGDKRDHAHLRSMKIKDAQGRIKIRLLLDKYSVEIFVNDGEKTMTSLIYTEQKARNILFQSEGNAAFCLTKHEIKVL